MERGEGSDWLETLGEEVGSAIVMAGETIQKNMKELGSIVKELWSNLTTEMHSQPNFERLNIACPEEGSSDEDDKLVTDQIKETSRTSSSMVQVKKGNLGCEETKPSDEDHLYSFSAASSDSEWELV